MKTAPLPRRRFLAGTAAAAASVSILKPGTVFGAAANSALEIGLIGCGGRGMWLTGLFMETGLYRFVAGADYFQDKVDKFGEKLGVDASRRYTGLSAYKRLLASKLDAVVIETPPYFHPQHAMDSVEAGKHVFLAKPVAVDVPGCLTIAEAGKKATAKKLVFLVDFQTRANEFYREALRRVRAGEIGKIIMGEAHYPWRGGRGGVRPTGGIEAMLRQWYCVVEISGDFIVEQNIHALDVATWILDADPIKAIGTGGRKVRQANSIYDHFAVNYQFPDNVPLSYTGIQGVPEMKDEISARVYGTEGYITTDYYSKVAIRGKEFYNGGDNSNLYTTGAQTNIREFHQFVTQGRYDNPTAAPSVRSNLTAVLGREAAYRGGEVTLAGLCKEGKRLELDLKGAKD